MPKQTAPTPAAGFAAEVLRLADGIAAGFARIREARVAAGVAPGEPLLGLRLEDAEPAAIGDA